MVVGRGIVLSRNDIRASLRQRKPADAHFAASTLVRSTGRR
jgi:hypothetical protein